MIQKLQNVLKEYNAHVLAYPMISNTDLVRDSFVSDTGNIYYTDLKTKANQLEFQIEFKGTDCEIRENRAKVSKLLELSTISFDEEIYYKGRFVESGIEKRYFFEVVTYKGQATAHLYTQAIEIFKGKSNPIYNNGDLKTPVRIILEGNGENIKISGFESPIIINNLDGKLIIDAEKGISDKNGVNNVSLFAFPYIEDYLDINISGSGEFKCFIEFEGRVIC